MSSDFLLKTHHWGGGETVSEVSFDREEHLWFSVLKEKYSIYRRGRFFFQRNLKVNARQHIHGKLVQFLCWKTPRSLHFKDTLTHFFMISRTLSFQLLNILMGGHERK